MPYEPTPELNDVLIWEHCDPPTGVTIIGWDVSGGVDLPLRSFTALNEAYQTARAHAEYKPTERVDSGPLEAPHVEVLPTLTQP